MTSLNNLPYFLSYFVSAVVLLAVFLFIYSKITRHDEWTLLAKGNTAAAVSLSGATLGFALPLASVIAHAASILDLLVWAVVALFFFIMLKKKKFIPWIFAKWLRTKLIQKCFSTKMVKPYQNDLGLAL